MFGRRHQLKPEHKTGVPGLRQQLQSKREFTKIYRKTIRLEIASKFPDLLLGCENQGLDIMEGLTPSKMEKEIAHGIRAGNVGAPATQDSFAPTVGKEKFWMMVMHMN
jgi:hypothetical protein